jgi:hypothetical protein
MKRDERGNMAERRPRRNLLVRKMAGIGVWRTLCLAAGLMAVAGLAFGDEPVGGAAPAGVTEPDGGESSEAPRIEFNSSTFDFGTMYQNEEVSHTFVLRNAGSGVLEIQRVKSSCGCTAAIPEKRELAAGEETTLKVTFKSGSRRDRVTQHVYVESNDPEQPRTDITVTGIVKVEVEVTPRSFYIGKLKVGEVVERSLEIKPVDADDFQILDVAANHPAVHVGKLAPLASEEESEDGDDGEAESDEEDVQGLGYRLTLRFGPVDEPGRISARVTVKTNLEHTEKLYISVYGKVVEEEAERAATNVQ